VLEQEDLYAEALEMYRLEKADFSDYLILAASRKQNCRLLTFDRQLGHSPGVTLISAPKK
jgi:predicted nucleic-acid-binding protein